METPSASPPFDVVIAGGGPSGAAAAIALAQAGRRVVLLERERFPRFHIGESLLATCVGAFRELGLEERVRSADFPVKWGALLLTHDGRAGRSVDFSLSREVATPQTWQVERARLDQMLLERAREAGAEVREGWRVADCTLNPDGVVVDAADEAGARTQIRAAALVDASGRVGLLAKKLDLRRLEPGLMNVAIYSHYRGVPRPQGRQAGDIRIVSRADAGWFWLIPIGPELVSVGVVMPRELYQRLERGSPEAMLSSLIADTPAVAELMTVAERVWPVRVERDFSYDTRSYAGDRWLMVGDAGSFLDPVFSSGVAIALESGVEAARELDRALGRGDLSAAAFRGFDRRQKARYRVFRRFVVGFYSREFRDLFFQSAPPPIIFRAVVTILAGIWRPRWSTRRLVDLFFAIVLLQRRFRLTPPLGRDDALAGFPNRGAA
ncbi:MAG: NAD(P)/FAD-dependent oxidoreductase [Thermoanaerobaculia bacterium]